MKKILLVCCVFFCVMASHAQNDSIARNNFGKNEVKINALFLIVGAFDVSYERNFPESSVGISVFVPFGYDDVDSNINYYISPYYRVFFGKKYAAGFFIEGFGMLNSIHTEYYTNSNSYTLAEERITDFALGFGVGGKWLTRGGFVFEVTGGIGRNLFNNKSDDYYDYSPIVGKLGFNLGYRF